MATCCSSGSYGEIFGAKQARRDARRYRKKGLDGTAQLMVDHVGDPEGATVLEVGGGVGAIGLELLKRGARHATNVDLSPAYDVEALALAREAGVEDRIERRVGDFVQDGVPRADVVAMHRVVCCYPDYERLLGAASDHAGSALVFSFPRETWWWRFGVRALNLVQRVRRRDFRAYVHPVARLQRVPTRHGLVLEFEHEGKVWRSASFRRR
jgi:cyclopropane fatty-acyl-phospholipid synthase-like methyltransferase